MPSGHIRPFWYMYFIPQYRDWNAFATNFSCKYFVNPKGANHDCSGDPVIHKINIKKLNYVILINIVNKKWILEKSLSCLIRRVMQLPGSAKFSFSVLKYFQHNLPKFASFNMTSLSNYKSKFPSWSIFQLYLCIILSRLNGKVENSLVRIFTFCYFHSKVWAISTGVYPNINIIFR